MKFTPSNQQGFLVPADNTFASDRVATRRWPSLRIFQIYLPFSQLSSRRRYTMHVLMLGAGASKCAGYPLDSELISEIKREAETESRYFVNFTNAWNTWEGSVSRTRGLLQLLLLNPNPEVVLSVPDLFKAAWNDTMAGQDKSLDFSTLSEFSVWTAYRFRDVT